MKVVAALVFAGLVVIAAPQVHADDPDATVGWHGASSTDRVAPDEAKKRLRDPGPSAPGGDYYQYRYEKYCDEDFAPGSIGPACATCPPGEGDMYSLQRRLVVGGVPTGDWEQDSQVCLTPGDVGEIDGQPLTPALVLAEFRKLDWPRAELSIQPPGGATLVNRPTFAFTTDPGPILKEVTLLGQDVAVEATASSWRWLWGDGAEDVTSSPGGPYPDGDVTHVYRKAHVTVRVRVDVTYVGRFRVGDGAWQELPESHTVPGGAEPLSVHEAIPQLVP